MENVRREITKRDEGKMAECNFEKECAGRKISIRCSNPNCVPGREDCPCGTTLKQALEAAEKQMPKSDRNPKVSDADLL